MSSTKLESVELIKSINDGNCKCDIIRTTISRTYKVIINIFISCELKINFCFEDTTLTGVLIKVINSKIIHMEIITAEIKKQLTEMLKNELEKSANILLCELKDSNLFNIDKIDRNFNHLKDVILNS